MQRSKKTRERRNDCAAPRLAVTVRTLSIVAAAERAHREELAAKHGPTEETRWPRGVIEYWNQVGSRRLSNAREPAVFVPSHCNIMNPEPPSLQEPLLQLMSLYRRRENTTHKRRGRCVGRCLRRPLPGHDTGSVSLRARATFGRGVRGAIEAIGASGGKGAGGFHGSKLC